MRDLWLAVAELVLSTNDDQPEESDLASAEHVAQLAVEIQARVAEALAGFAGGPPASTEDALRELCDVERLVREAGLIYWRDLARTPRLELRSSTQRRRRGAWPSWWSGVEQSLERCEEPLVAAGHAVGAAWHELVTAAAHRNDQDEHPQEVVVTNDKKQPGLPVVEVDQAFPLMTTDGVSRASTSTGITGDQGPAVSAAIRDVLGWRPRVQDPKAFTAALSASFELSTFEDHVVTKYVPRGVAVQADLGGVTGGQASLYLRAKAAHEQITRMLDSLQPLRTDADPQDCEAYRGLVRDSVRRIVMELGREGGPRVAAGRLRVLAC